MSARAAIAAVLAEASIEAGVAGTTDLSGGCIHRVQTLTLEDGTRVVVKLNDASHHAVLAGEAASLRALAATDTVLVPTPLGLAEADGTVALLLPFIEPGAADGDAWERFGRELAALHRADAGRRYGFDVDNHLGATPQPNGWCDDWIEFNRRHRFGHQVRLARDHGRLEAGEAARFDALIDDLDRWLPASPHPALLHGDLWSGNALPAADGRIAVIDPACSVGDGWADIAMMQLFGGFPPASHDAYAEARGETPDPARLALYRLYHVLNHVNLFGRGYVGQALVIVDGLG